MSKLQIIRRIRWVFTKHRVITITGIPPTKFPCRMLAEGEKVSTLEDGDTFYISIEYLTEKFPSCDGGYPGDWESIWRMKSKAQQFEYLKRSILEHGFLVPLDLGISRYSDRTVEFGNGHHRLTAARELGYTHVPVRINPTWHETTIRNVAVSDPTLNRWVDS